MAVRKQTQRRRTATRKRTQASREPDFGPESIVKLEPLYSGQAPAKAVRAVGATDVSGGRTAVYIHGIGNHPEEQVLIVRWDRALFGKDMGDRTRMAYWVNRARYPQASSCECLDPQCVCHDPDDVVRARGVLAKGSVDPDVELELAIRAITSDPAQQEFLASLGKPMLERAKEQSIEKAATAPVYTGKGIYAVNAKGIGDALLRKLTDLITGMALPDVQDFLFEHEHRQQMTDTFLARLRSGGGPFVVIAHSQGSMIAYDVLRRLGKADIDVRLFVTIGSPLGLPPVRSVFKKWTGKSKLPFPPCVSRWVNVAAAGDVVALDDELGNDIGPHPGATFQDFPISREKRDANRLFDGNAHSSMGYLSSSDVRREVVEAVGREFASSLGQQSINSDLVERYESSTDDFRHPVMIEIEQKNELGDASIEQGRQLIHKRLTELAKRGKNDVVELDIHHHARFISAKLNRAEIEVLRTEHEGLQVNRVWQNARKRALICRSAPMVQVTPAQQAYSAHGSGIEWAVLDTGIHHLHPHFADNRNIASIWDCTKSVRNSVTGISEPRGDFVTYEKDKVIWPAGADDFLDRNGHGTHVAGIIAGQYPYALQDDGDKLVFAGMAPKTRLHSFKVLKNNGEGDDASILVALDKIARINEQASELRIHGVNLSLGGAFDPSVYGCGHTPLCRELRRLWQQGVLIVLAAGNEGFTVLQTLEDGPWQANLDLSIGDPANLEEAIAVGSVHRVKPHTFGISYFSSRGPTADGRLKPDLVAPGEKILSARADFGRHIGEPPMPRPAALSREKLEGYKTEQMYVAESGTSMAAPHVSGLLAAFLSQRREFVGYPDRVKKILLDNCTDLQRDAYAQGAGLPNLMRMLGQT